MQQMNTISLYDATPAQTYQIVGTEQFDNFRSRPRLGEYLFHGQEIKVIDRRRDAHQSRVLVGIDGEFTMDDYLAKGIEVLLREDREE